MQTFFCAKLLFSSYNSSEKMDFMTRSKEDIRRYVPQSLDKRGKMFHSDYKHIIDRLPESLVKRACERLLHHSKDPVPLESIFGKSERIESYLRHTLEVYENSLNRKKCKTMAQEKVLHLQSWSECNIFPALLTISSPNIPPDVPLKSKFPRE